MRRYSGRLALWFGLSFVAATAVFATVTYLHFQQSLRGIARPGVVDSIPSQVALREVIRAFLILAVPYAFACVLWGWWLARRFVAPIEAATEKLHDINSSTLNRRLELHSRDDLFLDLEKSANQLLTRLEGSFGEVSEYASRVSHELRTPITILRLKVEQSGAKIDPELSEEIQSELQRLSHVVDQALLIARAEQGKLPLKPEPVNMATLLDHICEDFRLLAEGHHRRLIWRVSGDRWVRVDPKYCQQLVQTLLTNALVHGKGDIYLHLNRRKERILVSVGNQVRYSGRANELSLGLGLRVVRALLSVHPGCQFQQRHGATWHVSRLSFPEIETPTAPQRQGRRRFAED